MGGSTGQAPPSTRAAHGVSATMAFGLVTIPVRIHTATSPSDAELKNLDQKAPHGIEVQELVPPRSVDPVYFERTDYVPSSGQA